MALKRNHILVAHQKSRVYSKSVIQKKIDFICRNALDHFTLGGI
jgi:hypothetical protein